MFRNRSSHYLLDPSWGRLLTLGLLALLLISTSRAQSATTPTEEQLEFFESRIRPVLVEHCYACHNSADAAEGGLILDHRQGLLAGGDGGPIVTAGDPKRSRLIAVLRHEIEGLEMPEDGPQLADPVIRDFERWVAMGAPDPRQTPPSDEALSEATSWESMVKRRRQWWSFQPIEDPQVPSLEYSTSDNPIDRFIARRLQGFGLEPSPTASDATLIRRLYLTLIGLPPSPDETAEWSRRYAQSNVASKITGELIDHLLGSDHFGERWARHWMDWIRYAESHGSEGDPRIDNAWLYRDYLIRALNSDVPYNQLVREHVAGDLLDPPRVNEELGINESIIGTAHWRMVFHGFAPTDALDEKVRFIDDQINAFSKAVLGLTVSCARCHDHKFDAISQRDYYAMFGILASCRPGRLAIDLPGRQQRNREALLELKPKIREAIADDWLASLSELTKRLPGDGSNDEGQPDKQARAAIHSVVHPWTLLRELDEATFREAWQQLTQAVVEQPAVGRQADSGIVESWDFADPDGAASWNLVGSGLENQPIGPGGFAIAPSGNPIAGWDLSERHLLPPAIRQACRPADVARHRPFDQNRTLAAGPWRWASHGTLCRPRLSSARNGLSRHPIEARVEMGAFRSLLLDRRFGSPGSHHIEGCTATGQSTGAIVVRNLRSPFGQERIRTPTDRPAYLSAGRGSSKRRRSGIGSTAGRHVSDGDPPCH